MPDVSAAKKQNVTQELFDDLSNDEQQPDDEEDEEQSQSDKMVSSNKTARCRYSFMSHFMEPVFMDRVGNQ